MKALLAALLLTICVPAAAKSDTPDSVVQGLCHQYVLQAQKEAAKPHSPAEVKKALAANNLATQICNDPAITAASEQMVMRLLLQQLKDLQAAKWVAKPGA